MESNENNKISIGNCIQGFFNCWEGLFNFSFKMPSHLALQKQIEMLSCSQQETFSELTKLRDQQNKLESMLSSPERSKGFPLQENNTQIKGTIDAVGVVFAGDNVERTINLLDRAGIKSGIHSKFIFETFLRQKDTLLAEFVTGNQLDQHALTLTTLMYSAQVKDGLSLALAPLGALPTNLGVHSQGLLSSFLPPLLDEAHEYAAGVRIEGSKIAASVAQLVSGLATDSRSVASTYGQISYHPFEEMKLTLTGIWQMPISTSSLTRLGTFGIPLRGSKKAIRSTSPPETMSVSIARVANDSTTYGSMAVLFDTEYDEITRFSGWMEVDKSSSNLLKWGMSLSETPDDEIGWGMKLGGKFEGQLNQFQLEGHLNLPLCKNLRLQPGIAYVTEGRTGTPALLLQSSWSM